MNFASGLATGAAPLLALVQEDGAAATAVGIIVALGLCVVVIAVLLILIVVKLFAR
jgi:hypothetical protein